MAFTSFLRGLLPAGTEFLSIVNADVIYCELAPGRPIASRASAQLYLDCFCFPPFEVQPKTNFLFFRFGGIGKDGIDDRLWYETNG
jgi:hypothetical protein